MDIRKKIWKRPIRDSLYEAIVERGLIDPGLTGRDLERWMISFNGVFLSKLPERYYVLESLKDILGHEPEWSDMTSDFLRMLVNIWSNSMAQSSVRTYCAWMKSVFNEYPKKLPSDGKEFKDILNVKKQPSQQIYLSLEEIQKLEFYEPKTRNEEIILSQFLICCYTGMRHSDMLKLTKENISKDHMLRYVSLKTKVEAMLPAHKKLYVFIPVSKRKVFSDTTFNNTIRDICREVGIDEQITLFRGGKEMTEPKWKFIAGHVARRSFATNLYLAGMDIHSISKMMGHTNVNMTMGYICTNKFTLTNEAKKVFGL